MSGHVFISHGSEDRDEANKLSAFLEARGVKTWIAPRDVRPGMDYSEQLQLAIESCLAFIVLVTETANKSPYVRAETEMAFSTHKPIFPVRRSDIKPAYPRRDVSAFGSMANYSPARVSARVTHNEVLGDRECRKGTETLTVCGDEANPERRSPVRFARRDIAAVETYGASSPPGGAVQEPGETVVSGSDESRHTHDLAGVQGKCCVLDRPAR